MQIEASWSQPAPEVAVETPLTAPMPVVITPLRAQVEERIYVEVASHDVTTVSIPPVEIVPSAATDEPKSAEDQPLPALPRATSSTAAPAVNRQATPLVDLGTDSQEPPLFAGNRPPHYPELARQRGWEGTVLLRLRIDETGQVTEVTVANSSGHSVLDAEAVNAVKQWRAQPAKRGGRAVATEELLPVRFRMR